MISRSKFVLPTALLLLVFCASVMSAFSQGQVVHENDFEKGTQKWERRGAGGVSIGTTKKQARNGKKSLRVSGRKEFWQGAQLNVTKIIAPGITHRISVSVKLAKGESPDTVKLTMQAGDTKFAGVAAAEVDSNEWKTLSGNFRRTGNDGYLLIFVEAKRPRTSYYIDDFKIEAVKDGPSQSGTILKNDFEDRTAQNWTVMGAGVMMFSAADGTGRSLKIDNRTEAWHGFALDISPLFYKGRTYSISLSAKLVSGEPADSLKILIRQTPPGGKANFVDITKPTAVTDGEWVTLSGEYKAETIGNNLLILVVADGKSTSYYIDNFELKMPK